MSRNIGVFKYSELRGWGMSFQPENIVSSSS
jgi:hypothetical protein